MKFWPKLRALVRKDKLDAEMAEEMRLHLEMQTERNIAAGMDPNEARYAAWRQFGGVEQIKERCRDQRGWRWLDDFVQDLRIGLRTLLKEKGFCFAAVGVLALGICGVTTQFTIVSSALFNLLPFPESQQLMSLKLRDPRTAVRFAPNANIKGSDYRDFASEQQSFGQLAGYITVNRAVKIGGVTRTPVTLLMEHGLFDLLGVRPLLGRGFTAEDDRPGAEPVAVIGHDWWQNDFGGRPDIVGSTLSISGVIATIIGVMPADFAFPLGEQLSIPLHASMPDFPRGSEKWGMTVLGRLKPDRT
ncbi:MAG TPA: permease prefix domain 1-containing protein, partial [Opitutus sp.]|nr:permease prefix domain 1-containing protein [Opitutus sp.]